MIKCVLKTVMKPLILLTLMVSLANTAWALNLDEAKSQGLVGELSNGYLGLVKNSNSAVKSLVDDINRKRRAAYAAKAQKAGVELKIIEIRIGERLQERAKKGEYVQRSNGQWQKNNNNLKAFAVKPAQTECPQRRTG